MDVMSMFPMSSADMRIAAREDDAERYDAECRRQESSDHRCHTEVDTGRDVRGELVGQLTLPDEFLPVPAGSLFA